MARRRRRELVPGQKKTRKKFPARRARLARRRARARGGDGGARRAGRRRSTRRCGRRGQSHEKKRGGGLRRGRSRSRCRRTTSPPAPNATPRQKSGRRRRRRFGRSRFDATRKTKRRAPGGEPLGPYSAVSVAPSNAPVPVATPAPATRADLLTLEDRVRRLETILENHGIGTRGRVVAGRVQPFERTFVAYRRAGLVLKRRTYFELSKEDEIKEPLTLLRYYVLV